MVDSEQNDGLFPLGVGDRLRAAREAAGYDLNDIGTRTRVPMRHLEAIERNDFAGLPSPTYAIGFVKAYARAVGLDEAALARDVRIEVGRTEPVGRDIAVTELTDPARVPSRLLMITTMVILVVIVGGYLAWRNQMFGETAPAPTEAAAPPAAAPATPSAPAPAVAPAPAQGQVTLTATAAVWLRITDKGGARLFEKEMAAGERYDVPRDADDPRILTGRPDALKVAVDGREVAPLGPPERTIADVGVSAAALAARPAAPAPVATSGAPVTQ